LLLGLALLPPTLQAQPFAVNSTTPAIERWMYAFNADPCARTTSSTFGTFGDEAGVDTRHAQHLVGWDTPSLVPAARGPARYLVRRCRLTLTINRGNLFAYDPTQDGFRTYFETNHPAYLPDADAGRPVELFGVGYRNGFDATNFDQCATFGSNVAGERNAFVAGWAAWSTNGALVDLGNNVGKTNEAFPRFEVAPFAVGQTTNVPPGELMPAAAKMTFDLKLDDPFVLAYVQAALDTGRLRLMVSSLHGNTGQTGTPSYPDFVTQFNQAAFNPTRLELEGVAVRDADTDADGLPDDWEQFYFAGLERAATEDSDGDGAANLAEWRAGTNPALATDVLRLAIAPGGQGGVVLRWQPAASRRYTIQFTEDFADWQTVAEPTVKFPEPTLAEWQDIAPAATRRFYRLSVNEW
jgi:hypothetical protein